MSTVDLIYEKVKTLPVNLQSEALGFVEYLGRRRMADTEVFEWRELAQETQSLPEAQAITDAEIIAEITAYRSGR